MDKSKTFLDVLAGESKALAERLHFTPEQADVLREFVTTTAMRSWRNGRAIGFLRAKENK